VIVFSTKENPLMLALFQSIVDRIKAMFAADAALDLEAQFVSRQADRKADLLRKAAEFEREGLKGVAQDLRLQAESLSIQRPLDAILPAAAELGGASKPVPQLPHKTVAQAESKRGRRPLLAKAASNARRRKA
jgi:hypothetical protein